MQTGKTVAIATLFSRAKPCPWARFSDGAKPRPWASFSDLTRCQPCETQIRLADERLLSFLFRRRWQLVQRDVVGSGVAGFHLGFHASRILCLDLDSLRTSAFRNEVDLVEIHRFLTHFGSCSYAVSSGDRELKDGRTD